MVLRNLLYLRFVIFLAMLLSVLYCPDLKIDMGLMIFMLWAYACIHTALTWLLHRRAIPIDWDLYASVLDMVMMGLVVFALSGIEINLYVAYFVVVIGALVMESLVFGFMIAAVACLFYGITVAATPEAFVKPENLLPFTLLIVASFFITYVSSLIRGKRRAITREQNRLAIFGERLAASRRVLVNINDYLEQHLEHLATFSHKLPDKKKSSEIMWEVEGIRGHIKRIGNVLEVKKAKRTALAIQAPIEKAIYRLQAQISEGAYDIEFLEPPVAQVNGSMEHLAELFHGLIKDTMDHLPNGGKVSVSSKIRPPQWWERNEAMQGWLSVEIAGAAKTNGDESAKPPAETDDDETSAAEGAEWILISHGGRMEERPEPGKGPPRYLISLPICGGTDGQMPDAETA